MIDSSVRNIRSGAHKDTHEPKITASSSGSEYKAISIVESCSCDILNTKVVIANRRSAEFDSSRGSVNRIAFQSETHLRVRWPRCRHINPADLLISEAPSGSTSESQRQRVVEPCEEPQFLPLNRFQQARPRQSGELENFGPLRTGLAVK